MWIGILRISAYIYSLDVTFQDTSRCVAPLAAILRSLEATLQRGRTPNLVSKARRWSTNMLSVGY
jgi:hypothetical protein